MSSTDEKKGWVGKQVFALRKGFAWLRGYREIELPTPSVRRLAGEIERLAPDRAERLLEYLRRSLAGELGEEERFDVAEVFTSEVYPKYKFSDYSRLFLEDEAFLSYYARFMDSGNWHSLDRKYALDQLLRLTLHLPGDVAECGAYRGATAYLMCRAHAKTGRTVHLFDSFEGLSQPDPRDGTYWKPGALRSAEEVLRKNLETFTNFEVHKGWIPSRFGAVAERKFSFLHIDVDLYQPTHDTLAFFYERLTPGAIVLMDDYGFHTCPGAKKAADEFFADKPELIVNLPTGQALVQKR